MEEADTPTPVQTQMAQATRERLADFNRFMATSDDLLELIEHDLRGEVWIPREASWRAGVTPLVKKERGVQFIISEVRMRTNKNTFISDLSEKTIKNRVNGMLKTLNDAMFFYGDEFGIDPELMPTITTRVGDIVEFSMYRAKDHGERDYYGKSVFETTTRRIDSDRGILEHIPLLRKFGVQKSRDNL